MTRLRMGMIGGGEGSLIGPVHRMAARIDGMAELVCGAFSSDPAISEITGKREGIPASRIYNTWQEMIRNEDQLPSDARPHFVTIVTPNHLHYGPAMMALEAGFHVMCDKPLCISVAEAAELQEVVERTGRLFCLTHNYTGYPMVRRAREMILGGELGTIRKVIVEYLQGWMSTPVENTGNRQAAWRADPGRAGIAGAMADIGTHAFNLAEYITCQEVTALSATLRSVVPGRILDDDGTVTLLFGNGMNGTLIASQVATGEENNLSVRVYGEKGGLTWQQMEPNTLTLMWSDAPIQLIRTGTTFPGTGRAAPMHTRIPAGHPEGFIEAFANLYRNFMMHISALDEGRKPDPLADYPGINEGLRGMKFLEAVVASSARKAAITDL
ncbi:MAG: Gfo/Idh/MocA family oxidoreductase [Bacteroidales bacterium]|jgi:predicted dehydrogenase|nr:Gfo/Idh/MocA family oxidoreductase [Bacteroidales bacterium]NLD62940.1 Gfo/Idh/MocA family oxidoreductase [Bacteroidales bacterium]HNT92159.1 Gfo/Idh/MocA family oxidoreductase [Bacteroidales bacterium]HOO66757.1 Gfo/Idh/MocA family oxidoreductase [Bacteroidales bacterium]HPE22732.1 Gfo/Idh/MocA family oxidoreductase [Bacteroidales bacterium]